MLSAAHWSSASLILPRLVGKAGCDPLTASCHACFLSWRKTWSCFHWPPWEWCIGKSCINMIWWTQGFTDIETEDALVATPLQRGFHFSLLSVGITLGLHMRKAQMWRLGTWFSSHGGHELMVGLHDLSGLFQPWWLYDDGSILSYDSMRLKPHSLQGLYSMPKETSPGLLCNLRGEKKKRWSNVPKIPIKHVPEVELCPISPVAQSLLFSILSCQMSWKEEMQTLRWKEWHWQHTC